MFIEANRSCRFVRFCELDTGAIVTHRSIERARDAGVLNILLNSVHREKPDLFTDELKAKKDRKE